MRIPTRDLIDMTLVSEDTDKLNNPVDPDESVDPDEEDDEDEEDEGS